MFFLFLIFGFIGISTQGIRIYKNLFFLTFFFSSVVNIQIIAKIAQHSAADESDSFFQFFLLASLFFNYISLLTMVTSVTFWTLGHKIKIFSLNIRKNGWISHFTARPREKIKVFHNFLVWAASTASCWYVPLKLQSNNRLIISK